MEQSIEWRKCSIWHPFMLSSPKEDGEDEDGGTDIPVNSLELVIPFEIS